MAEVELPNTEELEEVRSKAFTRRVALVTAVFAVILAISSLGGNSSMKEMLLAQQQSSDQWSFYQAKVIREHLYRSQKMKVEADLLERGSAMKPEVRKHYETMLKNLADEEARYRSEKKEIEQEAKNLEHERDLSRRRNPYFEYAEVLLQIAIVMASISILAVSRTIFSFALVVAILGAFMSLNGFLLLIKLPFLH